MVSFFSVQEPSALRQVADHLHDTADYLPAYGRCPQCRLRSLIQLAFSCNRINPSSLNVLRLAKALKLFTSISAWMVFFAM